MRAGVVDQAVDQVTSAPYSAALDAIGVGASCGMKT